jgi:hypothetical protein
VEGRDLSSRQTQYVVKDLGDWATYKLHDGGQVIAAELGPTGSYREEPEGNPSGPLGVVLDLLAQEEGITRAPPPAAPPDVEPGKSVRHAVLDHLTDTDEAQSIGQIVAGTGVDRNTLQSEVGKCGANYSGFRSYGNIS